MSGPVVAWGVDTCVEVEPSIGRPLAKESREQKEHSGKSMRFPDERLWAEDGLVRLKVRERSFARARHDLEREPCAENPYTRFDDRREESRSRWSQGHRYGGESRRTTAVSSRPDRRAALRLDV